jgi:hypothetical protein
MNMKYLIIAISVGALLLTACSDDDSNETSVAELNLELSGLEDLGSSFTYEGWIMVDGSPVSTGTFDVDGSGNLTQSSFDVDLADLESATAFILSIEPVPDADPAPSDVKILGGAFSGNIASVSISHPAALGTSFTGASGGFILATPTTSSPDDNEAGVWFLDNSGGTPAAGLTNLPDLSSLPGWRYEGWAVIDGVPVSTGTFNRAEGADDNASTSSFKGLDSDGPGYPGEDFINNAPMGLTFPADLRAAGTNIVISIEPVPDNSPAPFTLKPLAGSAEGAELATFTMLQNIAASTYPGGTVSR